MDLIVNGDLFQVADEPDRPLLWVLRDELGLTGTKFGCGIGVCGSCEVHVDGQITRSCITMLSTVQGATIRTIEGLASEESLHPVQQAFIDEQAPQCGWCMSGQIMHAAAFLEEKPTPTEEEIALAMSSNYSAAAPMAESGARCPGLRHRWQVMEAPRERTKHRDSKPEHRPVTAPVEDQPAWIPRGHGRHWHCPRPRHTAGPAGAPSTGGRHD